MELFNPPPISQSISGTDVEVLELEVFAVVSVVSVGRSPLLLLRFGSRDRFHFELRIRVGGRSRAVLHLDILDGLLLGPNVLENIYFIIFSQFLLLHLLY